MTLLTTDELAAILRVSPAGLRVSEAMGLRWEDVDYSESEGRAAEKAAVDGRGAPKPDGSAALALTVRYQLARINGEPVLAEPKSPRSRRTILLPPLAAAALRRHSALQAAERLAAGTRWRDATGLVFTAKDGAPLSESTLQWVMARACRATGIRHMSPHDLRRYVASIMVAAGDAKAAAAVMGHVSSALTVDGYASATDAGLRRAADAVEGELG